jgi:gliding motility-associated-like protein
MYILLNVENMEWNLKNGHKGIFIFLLLLFIYIPVTKAHHLRAGDITLELISCQSYTYLLTITGYTDSRVLLEFGYEVLDFGDGTFINLDTCTPVSKKDLDDFVTVKTFKIRHTFPGPGIFTVRYHEPNRNDNVLNMLNSGYVAFYVESQVIIDPFLFCNNTPILLNAPIDKGVVGQIYEHNPAAWDPDGDSLAYKMIPCKQNRDMTVPYYRMPNIHDIEEVGATNMIGTSPATMKMDPVTGIIIWDSPAIAGQYNIAFMVEEWRKINGEWFKLGFVTRDMQILIEESENNPPKLYAPPDTCIEAGTVLDFDIFAEDPDGHDISIEAYSGIFNMFGSAVTVIPDPPVASPSPTSLHFNWKTHCYHVRAKPYHITFKAIDHPVQLNEQPPLVDFESWLVTIVPPAPTGLAAESTINNNILLSWDPYPCTNADKIQIWRRVGSYDFQYGYCETGIPTSAGYELIDEVPASDISYFDTGKNNGLIYGAKYCYRLVTVFPLPGNGISYPSEEVCIILGTDKGPVITNVDVEKTDSRIGEIIIKWTSPQQIRDDLYEKPYSYHLFRMDSINISIDADTVAILETTDTTYIDQNLNTENKKYHYQVRLYDNRDSLMSKSGWASSVRLNSSPVPDGIVLSWQAEVPWSNNSFHYPQHFIYRDHISSSQPEILQLIDSVNVHINGFQYTDKGQVNDQPLIMNEKYHYYVKTSGSYDNPGLPEPLINRSQIIGIYPNDTVPPCTPLEISFGNVTSIFDCIEFIKDKPCDYHEFYNEIFWEKDLSGDCDSDYSSFNIYFSEVSVDGPYGLISNVKDTFFIHSHLQSFAGCYRISSLDNFGNESDWSDPICHDNCPQYELPNVFTPNNDGVNDTFRAFDRPNSKCPRFVRKVNFRIYNRWGFEVYNSENQMENLANENEPNIYIDWDGRDLTGKMLPAGTYYYVAEVYFEALDPVLSQHIYKGWVELLK